MKYQLVFTDVSINDITKAKTWYKKQQTGLGKKFTDIVFKSAREIQLAPLAYPNKYKYTAKSISKNSPTLLYIVLRKTSYLYSGYLIAKRTLIRNIETPLYKFNRKPNTKPA